MNRGSALFENFRLLDHIPVGVCVLDGGWGIVFWNRCLESWTKQPRAEVIGRTLDSVCPRFDSPGVKRRINTVLGGGASTVLSARNHGHLFSSSRGKSRVFQTTVSRVSLPNETGPFVLLAVEDVTKLSSKIKDFQKIQKKAEHEIENRKSMEAELKAVNERAVRHQNGVIEEERLKVLLQMAGATAHELNQPLMILLGNVELLGMDMGDPEKMAVHISKIEQAGKRMADIVRKIQEVKRVAKKPYSGGDEIIDIDAPSQK